MVVFATRVDIYNTILSVQILWYSLHPQFFLTFFQIGNKQNSQQFSLKILLIGMENVLGIYEDWSPEPISDQTKRAYEKASQKLSLCMEHEEKLVG